MNIETTAFPTQQALSLDDAKAHLRVDLSDDDEVVKAAVGGAVAFCETFLRKRLLTQTVKITATGFWCGPMPLYIGPVQSIDLVQYKQETDGALTTLAASEYQLVRTAAPTHIAPAYEKTWPTVRSDFDAVEITLTVGYGDSRTDIPPDILSAVRLMTGHFYENREDEVTGTQISKFQTGAERLLMPHVLHV